LETGNTDTGRELLLLVSGGDEGSFKSLFSLYWPQVYGTALHLTRSPEWAKDLAQEIFLKLWDSRHKLSDVERPDAYIYILSKNLVLDELRKKIFAPSNMEFLQEYADADSPQSGLEYKELESILQEAVAALPGKMKEVFCLRKYEGLSHPEIARKLDISVVSSRTYIVRATQAIRDRLSLQARHLIYLLFTLFFIGGK
jgi:RNA polymerase sigma-70 factor (family 1)